MLKNSKKGVNMLQSLLTKATEEMGKWDVVLMVLIIVASVLCIVCISCIVAMVCIGWWVNTSRRYKHLKYRVEDAWGTIERRLQKRAELVNVYISCIRKITGEDDEDLQRLSAACKFASEESSQAQIINSNAKLTILLREFIANVPVKYPQVISNEIYLGAYYQLTGVEEDLNKSRKYYNSTVKAFNAKLTKFPSRIVANRMEEQYDKELYFYLDESEEKRRNEKR